MSVEIKEVTIKGDAKQFVNLPFEIYKGNKFWVPPLKEGEMKSLFAETNPAFDFLKEKAEDVYTRADGKPFHDQR